MWNIKSAQSACNISFIWSFSLITDSQHTWSTHYHSHVPWYNEMLNASKIQTYHSINENPYLHFINTLRYLNANIKQQYCFTVFEHHRYFLKQGTEYGNRTYSVTDSANFSYYDELKHCLRHFSSCLFISKRKWCKTLLKYLSTAYTIQYRPEQSSSFCQNVGKIPINHRFSQTRFRKAAFTLTWSRASPQRARVCVFCVFYVCVCACALCVYMNEVS